MKWKLFGLMVAAFALVGLGCGGRSPERGYAGTYVLSEVSLKLDQDGTLKHEIEIGRWMADGHWKEWKEAQRSGIDIYVENEVLRFENLGQGIHLHKNSTGVLYLCCFERGQRGSGVGYSGIYALAQGSLKIREDRTISMSFDRQESTGKWEGWEEEGKKGIEISLEGEEPFRMEDRGQGILRFEEPESQTGYWYWFRIEPEMVEKTKQQSTEKTEALHGDKIIGRWQKFDDQWRMESVEFSKDGSIAKLNFKGEYLYGDYRLMGSSLRINFPRVGFEAYEISELSEDKLILKDRGEVSSTYRRVNIISEDCEHPGPYKPPEVDWVCARCGKYFVASIQRETMGCSEYACMGQVVRSYFYYNTRTRELLELYREKPASGADLDMMKPEDRLVKEPGGEWQRVDPGVEAEYGFPVRVDNPDHLRYAPPGSEFRR